MICYFQKGLKLFIKIEIKQQDRKFVNFEEIVQRAVNAEAKASPRSTIMVRDLDIHCPQSHCLSNNTALKVQTQETTVKDSSYPKKPKTKDLKSVPLHDNLAELAKKEDKQKRFKRQRERIREPKETPATGDNIVNTAKKKKKYDTSKVPCFNCNKNGHYASDCTEPKNECQSWQPPCR